MIANLKIKLSRIYYEHKTAILIGALSFVVACFIVALLNSLTYKAAVIDVQSVVAKSSQVVVLKQEQEQKMAALQKWINDAKADVEKQKNKDKKESLLKKYNEEFVQKQKDLSAEYVKKLQIIDKNISDIIAEEAKALGYDIVASKGVILYGAEDITDQVAQKIQ